MKQQPLKIQPPLQSNFDNFYPGQNQHLVNCLKAFVRGEGETFIYLWGPPGAGCSHLLQACCQLASDERQRSMYIPLKEPHLKPEILHSVETLQLVCLDDIEGLLNDATWEEALLHFYNRARESGLRLIVAAHEPPRQLTCQLPDLQSRLTWGLVFHLAALSDEQKILALQMRAEHLGLMMPREVGQFLLHHYTRDSTTLFRILFKLDELVWETKRRLTVPFVKEALGLK
jgi:DnaA family protein